MASLMNLVSTIEAQTSPKKGEGTKCPDVSASPCRHATPVADAPWKLLFSNIKFSMKSNQGKYHAFVVSNQ